MAWEGVEGGGFQSPFAPFSGPLFTLFPGLATFSRWVHLTFNYRGKMNTCNFPLMKESNIKRGHLLNLQTKAASSSNEGDAQVLPEASQAGIFAAHPLTAAASRGR